MSLSQPVAPPPPPPGRMHCFGKATFLNVFYLCCHGCALQLCRWRRANNFFRLPSGHFPTPLLAVEVGPQHQQLHKRQPQKKKQQET